MTIATFLLVALLVSTVTSTAISAYYKKTFHGLHCLLLGLLAALTAMSVFGYEGWL